MHPLTYTFCLSAVKSKTSTQNRASRLSALELLEKKNERKASLKERVLVQRKLEVKFQKKNYEDEVSERKKRLSMKLEEKRMPLLKDKL